MADVTITAASVLQVNGIADQYLAGETLTQGQPFYVLAADNKAYKADNNAAAAAAAVKGIALNCASAGQPVRGQRNGQITIGGTLVKGTIYVLSATAGGIAPAADLASGNRVSILGVASSTTVLDLSLVNTGIAL
jgi:hypothetical protein